MLDSSLENQLIYPDIADLMIDYVSMQPDIDERRVKAACIIAQNIDIERIIGEDNLLRIIETDEHEAVDADEELKNLILAPLCYYTYSRLLLSFQGSYTDSGYGNEELVAARNEAKSVSKEMKSVGEAFMQKVIKFLDSESPSSKIDEGKLSPKIRVFGGEECRGSN